MAKPAKPPAYLRLRRWVDRELVAYQKHATPFWAPTFLAVLILMGGAQVAPRPLEPFVWATVGTPWVVWMTFLGWRTSRLIRASAIRGDREYDQRGKYQLPPEYARTESLTAIKRRVRRADRGPV